MHTTGSPRGAPCRGNETDVLLELFEEIAGRAGDVNSARNAALTILDALDDAGGFGALRAIRALIGIHDLLAVACLGNLCHNACSP
jgi:hypothetical protein